MERTLLFNFPAICRRSVATPTRPLPSLFAPEPVSSRAMPAMETGAAIQELPVAQELDRITKLTTLQEVPPSQAMAATATRNNVYAGVRREQVASLKDEIAKASARLEYVQAQLTRTSTLARQSFESQQALDQAENDAASARADVAEAQANYDAAVAGPTREERSIAAAQVQA